jgi:hypothetical protein
MASIRIVIAALLLLGSAASGAMQERDARCVNPAGGAGASAAGVTDDFCGRIAAYVTLRGELQEGLPGLQITDDVAAIRHAVRALATKIRSTDDRPSEGGIFTPRISDQLRTRLHRVVTSDTCATILEDNPGRLSHPVSEDYPEGTPLSTMPVMVLAILPGLPPDMSYRFAGSDLILLDTRANIVVDRIVDAVACADGDVDRLSAERRHVD